MTADIEKKVRVLVAEDSPTVQELLVHILNADPGIEVVGTANNGKRAIEQAARLKPDAITMDFHMPVMNGLEATRRIMETAPVPIVIVSASCVPEEVESAFLAVEAGAVAVANKPQGTGSPEHEADARELVQAVKMVAGVKLVRRKAKKRELPFTPVALPKVRPFITLVAIGASTGGPPVLRTLLSRLPPEFPAAVLIVQHMAVGFIAGFAEWLSQITGFPVQLATDGAKLQPGHAYIAPDGYHMLLGSGNRIKLTQDKPENGSRPSVSHLFRSIALNSAGNSVGVLLTGMGRDGADELGLMKTNGAITIAQNEESSAIFGMPGEAVKRGVVQYVLPPEGIADLLLSLAPPG